MFRRGRGRQALVEPGPLRHAQQPGLPSRDDGRIEHHDALHPMRLLQRREHRQVAAKRMADQPDLWMIRARFLAVTPDVVQQLISQMRPVARDRITRIVAVAFDAANLEVVREFGEDRPVRRGGKVVRVREVDANAREHDLRAECRSAPRRARRCAKARCRAMHSAHGPSDSDGGNGWDSLLETPPRGAARNRGRARSTKCGCRDAARSARRRRAPRLPARSACVQRPLQYRRRIASSATPRSRSAIRTTMRSACPRAARAAARAREIRRRPSSSAVRRRSAASVRRPRGRNRNG